MSRSRRQFSEVPDVVDQMEETELFVVRRFLHTTKLVDEDGEVLIEVVQELD